MLIVDAHLDLSYNALRGRNVLKSAAQQQADEEGIPTVGLPDLRRGGVGLICATIFCEPVIGPKPGYGTGDEATAMARWHLDWYREQIGRGRIRFVTTPDKVPVDATSSSDEQSAQPAILLLEGSDAIASPDDVPGWFGAGLRIVGLAWKRTRMAGGTGEPGPLTEEGRRLVRALDASRIIHDLSHLAEESFWNLLDMSSGPVIASHSNCRAIVPTDRQLSDEMVRAVIERGGVIGINFFDKFLLPPEEYGQRRATLSDVVRHVRHMCDLAGNARHVGLGTDMDGGLGREQIPVEIQSSADLPRVADALSAAGFADRDVEAVMGRNWAEYFRRNLPGAR